MYTVWLTRYSVQKAPHDAAPVISMVIQELEGSPTVKKRRLPPAEAPPIVPPPTELVVEADWTMATSPRKKKEKDVFKFLKESDTNYTIRRQQLQMNLVLEKNQHVKKVTLIYTLWVCALTLCVCDTGCGGCVRCGAG